MPLAIEDVITPTTAAEIEAEILSLCATGGLPTSSWQSGSWIRTMIAEISEVIYRKSLVETEIARGAFGDLASPSWVKLWAQAIYNVFFVPAMIAKGNVTAVNVEPTQHDLDPGELVIAHKVTGKTYKNSAAISILGNSTLPNIAIEAFEVGTTSNAAPNMIQNIVGPAMIGVTITNPLAVLGADEETAKAIVLRARAKLGSLSPLGPKDAYDFVARTPLDEFPEVEGTLLTKTDTPITRSRTTSDKTTGEVIVYIATAAGAPTPTDVDRVNRGIWRWAEPHCVEAEALAAAELAIPITYRVWIRSSLTSDQIKTVIDTKLAQYLAAVDVGGVVVPPDTGAIYREALTFVIHTALPGIERVEVTLPAVETTTLLPNQVPILGTITSTVTIL